MRAVVDRLQGSAPESPGRVALGGRLRLGTGPERRGTLVPDVAQPLAGISGPQGDQFQTPDVTGESASVQTTKPADDGFDSHLQAISCDCAHTLLYALPCFLFTLWDYQVQPPDTERFHKLI